MSSQEHAARKCSFAGLLLKGPCLLVTYQLLASQGPGNIRMDLFPWSEQVYNSGIFLLQVQLAERLCWIALLPALE